MNRRMFYFTSFLGLLGIKLPTADNPDNLPILEFDERGRINNRKKLMEGIPFTLCGEYSKGELWHTKSWQRKRRVWTNEYVVVDGLPPIHKKGEAILFENLSSSVNNPLFPRLTYYIGFPESAPKGARLIPSFGNASLEESKEIIKGIKS